MSETVDPITEKEIKLYNKVQDSGKRTEFSTGSKRDKKTGKGRNDLMPLLALQSVSKHFENGANKYGERNWELGQPLSNYWDSAFRHLVKFYLGLKEEDHLSACIWNLMALQETKYRIEMGILSEELNDLPDTYSDEELQKQVLKFFGE